MDEPMIVFLTKDLMIQSNASSAAKRSGVQIKAASNLDEAIAIVGDGAARLLLVDLQMPGLEVSDLIGRFAELESPCRAIAFAQHVEEELLALARAGGFESVLTRGQFSRDLPKIVKEFACHQPHES